MALEPDVPCVVGIPAQMREAGPGKPADHAGSTSAARPTGRGVKVAVIDTGVSDHPRLGGVEPIADFVTPQDADPLTDCDGHGTAVAGAIAARDTGDGLSGIAPDAQVLSIRQTNAHYRRPASGDGASDPAAPGAGDLGSLAEAIERTVNAGARVINVSVVSCVEPAHAQQLDTGRLDDSLARAEEAGAVVVAAAGNASARCAPDSVVYPAFASTVLAVGALDAAHRPAEYSLHPGAGALAGPGTIPVALDPTGPGLTRGVVDPATLNEREFTGTSFAAPYVSGLAAALFERYPEESPAEMRERLLQIAQPPAGALDPDQALAHLRGVAPDDTQDFGTRGAIATPERADTGPMRRALAIAIAAAVVIWLVATAIPGRGTCRRSPHGRSSK
ncbi:S8 family serine peptidase [Corynebacterium atypicum]|uniref:S8 family serine peptidase n=1 Tax=Corynebacterium atypicum TaxID=191610 RepID=UPI000B1F0C8F|nr:S8 family serine peptidase [Corynebacterium atypicum]